MTLQLHSPAFENGDRLPVRHTADGEDLSPPLAWTGAPAATAELTLVMEDPDAPGDEPWVHWVLYHIPAGTRELPEHLHRVKTLAHPAGATQGRNSWSKNNLGYRGPAPPTGDGPHRYRFRLYALNEQLQLPPGVDRTALLEHMRGHVLAEAELTGLYERRAQECEPGPTSPRAYHER